MAVFFSCPFQGQVTEAQSDKWLFQVRMLLSSVPGKSCYGRLWERYQPLWGEAIVITQVPEAQEGQEDCPALFRDASCRGCWEDRVAS